VIDETRRIHFLHEDLDPISYEWILELAKHKINYLTSLIEVRFRELESQIGQVFSSEEWDPPLKVDWAFDEAGVNLIVCVRSAHVDRRPRFKGYPIHPGFKQDLESLPDRNIEENLSNCLFSRFLSFSSLCTLHITFSPQYSPGPISSLQTLTKTTRSKFISGTCYPLRTLFSLRKG
jgi:hypothetical protein